MDCTGVTYQFTTTVDHSVAHVPLILVVGRQEAEARTVALRRLGGQAQEVLSLDEAVARIAAEATPPDLRP